LGVLSNLKLALGTVQFGLDYGITNKKGKIPKKEVFEILEYAFENQIDTLDTAYAYGDSEKVIGEFIKESKKEFRIISKAQSNNIKKVEKMFYQSLERLNQEKIYGYLIHDFKKFLNNKNFFCMLQKFKAEGKIDKIGFSLYHPKEASYLLDKEISFDIIQVPFNIFDQRFSKIIPLLRENGVEIHVRSVFLQGLVFREPEKLERSFIKIKNRLLELREVSKDLNVPISTLCINFAVLNENIDAVVIGVDSLDNLKENIKSLDYKFQCTKVYENLLNMKEEDENIILPMNWKK
jgi:aryl-alcohol dehydrogenase-like predicted oxidoreductase